MAAELAGQLGQPVTAYDQVPAAVDGADIVVTATSSSASAGCATTTAPVRVCTSGRACQWS